ncbi:GRP family sugar transporter [Lentilactobacillus kisonensis]|uniref:Sugar transport protein n=1 Tax=Lentilactobacillus kisonensis F0435 TaxID=797516 RepID=H1LBU1_9LACO|nr:GRP family sugar transporter [Lentilactobacillus kisonensis]EHO54604.1 sugar transport protein [Lentilactobacillus kisonensis F0435]
MNLLIGIIPAIFWGVLPIWMRKVTGGSFLQQLLGTSVGIVITATALQLIFRYDINARDFLLYYVSGACWSIGQGGQYREYGCLGVSGTMPVSTAFQIIGNSLIGGWLFGEWQGISASLMGLIALVVIIAGVVITNGLAAGSLKNLPEYGFLLITTIGYWGYSGFPHYASSGAGINGFLPQSLGMLTMAAIIYVSGRKKFPGNDPIGFRNITSGLIFSVAASTYLISLQLNGLVSAFILTQLNVVVSTILGIVILKEANRKKVVTASIGLAVLIAGAVMMVMI